MFAAGALVLTLIGEANDWPALYQQYRTATPLNAYLGQVASSLLIEVVLGAAAAFGAAMGADVFLQMAMPGRRLPAFQWRRALMAAILAGAAWQLGEWVLQQMPGPRARLPLWNIDGLDSALPALSALRDNLSAAFLTVALGTAYVCGGLRMIERRKLVPALGILVLVLAAGRTLTPLQAPFTVLASAVTVGAGVLIVMTCGADVASIACGLFLLLTASSAWRLFQQPLDFLKWNAAALVVISFLIVTMVARRLR